MLIYCTNKGCHQTSDAQLNRDTNEVICMDCGNPIENVPEYTKRTLKQMGQVIRAQAKQSFSKQCPKCALPRKLVVRGDQAHCEVCDTVIEVTMPFLQALKASQDGKEK